nr:hypothetical protein [Tanacetum cinerariifolium]
MCTRSSSILPGESSPNITSFNPKRYNRIRSKQPFILEESPVDSMADHRTMAELLRTPTEGYAEAIVVLLILVEQFELKHSLINMMTSNQFFRLEKDNPRDHIRWFNKITSTIKYKDVSNSVIKLMLVPFSLTGAACRWLKKEPLRSILTWEDLVSKFINEFFPPSRTTNLRNEILNFQQRFNESFHEAWDRYKISFVHALIMCLTADGNTFPKLRDNVQGYVSAAAVNYNQGNTTANPKGELKAITTRSGIVLDGPSIPMPPPFINPEEDECVEETLTDQDLAEYTIKVPHPLVQKPKPPSQRNFVVHQRDPLYPNIPYPSRMHKQKQQEKDEVQIYKFWQLFKQLHINITFVDALILIPKYQKMLKALLSNKEKLLELANKPLNENCLAVILKKLPEKLGDPGKFFIPCGFSELKYKALADLANRAICTPAGIARDVFVPVGKFTFLADFVIVDYESDPRVPLILGRPFLRTAHALIDVHGEEMILRDGDERLTLNMRHDTSSYSNQPQKESINMINIYDDSCEDFLKDLFATNHLNLPLHHNINPLSGRTTSSSPNHLLEEFIDEITLITFLPGNDDLPFDIECDLKEIEYLLNHDPIKEMDSILKDSVDEDNIFDLNDNLVDTMPEMFTDEHALDDSFPPLYNEYDDDLFKVESSDFLPSLEYDSFLFEDFSEVDALPSTNNEDKVFNLGILIHENLSKVTTRVVPDKNVKKIAISHASLILEDFDPPLFDYELPCYKEVPRSETLLSFSSKNEEKVFKPGILTSKRVHSSLISELSHRGPKVFKVIKIFESPTEIFPCSFREDVRILDVPCLHFYPP